MWTTVDCTSFGRLFHSCWCVSSKGTVAIVEVGCDGQPVLRSSLNEVAAVSRLTLETRSRSSSAEQTSVVETLFTPFTTAADIGLQIHV